MTLPGITVNPTDPTPPYEQLRRQLHDLIAAGHLPVGERLPSVRQLAGDLGLAAGTVARTYRELEGAGLLESRRGGGTRVAARPAQHDPLGTLTATYVERAQAMGYSVEQIRAAVLRASR